MNQIRKVNEIFIPGNVPSLKNSKVATATGIFPSKTVTKYLHSLGIKYYSSRKKLVVGYKLRPNLFAQYCEQLVSLEGKPVVIGFHFIRRSRHKFDFHNAVQILADLMVAHNVLAEDDMDEFIPVPLMKKGAWYTYNKSTPGVYIKILTNLRIE